VYRTLFALFILNSAVVFLFADLWLQVHVSSTLSLPSVSTTDEPPALGVVASVRRINSRVLFLFHHLCIIQLAHAI
jgi:hypothetical protein